MKSYPKYKDSGISFVEKIPEQWEKRRFGFIVNFNKGLNITKADLRDAGIPCVNYGEVHSKYGFEVNPDKHVLRCVDEKYLSESPRSLLSEGEFVFADTSEDIEGAGNFTYLNSKTRAFAGYHTIIARTTKPILPRYLAYQLDAKPNRAQIQNKVSGIKVFSISQGILKNVTLFLPPLPEQRAIAAYLDRETAKIDTLIAKQEQLIALLEEKRQALISHTVTKGLDPNVKLKDSGVEWLGKVPEHWDICAVRRFLLSHRQGYYDESGYVDSGIKLLRITDIRYDNEFSLDESPMVENIPSTKAFTLSEGDFVFVRTGASAGDFALIRNLKAPAIYASYLIRFRFKPSIVYPVYLKYFFNSTFFREKMNANIHGGVNTNVHAEDIKYSTVLLPPLAEQRKITEYLVEKTRTIHALMDKARQAVEIMREKRSALISAAVTGKIDVRDQVPT